MENYSFNDLSVGDIYEHWAGGYWLIEDVNTYTKKYRSVRVNSPNETQEHTIDGVRQIWLKVQ